MPPGKNKHIDIKTNYIKPSGNYSCRLKETTQTEVEEVRMRRAGRLDFVHPAHFKAHFFALQVGVGVIASEDADEI